MRSFWLLLLATLLPLLAEAQSTGINGGGPNGGGGGSGTVTSISAGTGITATPNPIIGTGTIALTVPISQSNILTCAANRIVYDNASAQLSCSSGLTYDGSQIITLTNATAPQYRAFVSGAPSGQRLWAIRFDGVNGFDVIPLTDAGVDNTGTHMLLTRVAGGIDSFNYLDDNGTNVQFDFNDILLQGASASAPGVRIDDPAASLGSSFFEAGVGGASASPTVAGYLLCIGATGNPNTMNGLTLTNGSTVAHCDVSTGQTNLLGVDANIPLQFGTNSLFAGVISNVDQGWEIGIPTGLSKGSGTINAQNGVFDAGTRIKTVLTGTTGSIGGGALTSGTCATGTATVTGATNAMSITATPATTPGAAFYQSPPYVSSSNTVTVSICAVVAGTPTATTYNVRVLQ